jgi:hypothetical protein
MEILIPLVVALITQLVKRFGAKNTILGDYGLYIFTFLFSVLISAAQFGWKWLPGAYTQMASEIFAGAMVWYEVLLKRIPIVRKLGGQE